MNLTAFERLLHRALSLREQVAKLIVALEAETTFENEDPAITEAKHVCRGFDTAVDELLPRKDGPLP